MPIVRRGKLGSRVPSASSSDGNCESLNDFKNNPSTPFLDFLYLWQCEALDLSVSSYTQNAATTNVSLDFRRLDAKTNGLLKSCGWSSLSEEWGSWDHDGKESPRLSLASSWGGFQKSDDEPSLSLDSSSNDSMSARCLCCDDSEETTTSYIVKSSLRLASSTAARRCTTIRRLSRRPSRLNGFGDDVLRPAFIISGKIQGKDPMDPLDSETRIGSSVVMAASELMF